MPGFEGPVEVDETYIGGKAKNMHARQRRERIHGRGAVGKIPVVGVKDRTTDRVAARPVADTDAATLTGEVQATTVPKATIYTDGSRGYDHLAALGFTHARVMHSVGEYVRGSVSTNGIENYWSLLKRSYLGTYHYWSPEHLARYVTEHSFRYNRRSEHVLVRMGEAAASMEGRSLTYRELTGSRG